MVNAGVKLLIFVKSEMLGFHLAFWFVLVIFMVLKFMMIGACAPWSFGLFKQSINLCLYHGVNGSCVVLVLRHVYDCMFALMYLCHLSNCLNKFNLQLILLLNGNDMK